MAFTVEDGTGEVAGANSYQSLAAFKAHHADRGNDLTAHSDANIEKALVRATDFLDGNYKFRGSIRSDEQPLEWPRYGAYDDEGRLLEGVPNALLMAANELGLVALSGDLQPNPAYDDTGQSLKRKKEVVGPIEEETEYQAGGARTTTRTYPSATRWLRGLTVRQSGRVTR